jgi:ATP-binding cassette subfamily F protein 3
MSILAVSGLVRRFGDRVVLRDVTFRVAQGERIGVVGPNGSGKSTLLRALASGETDAGTTARRRGLRVGLLEQELAAGERTIAGLVGAARARLDRLEVELRELEGKLAEPEAFARYAELQAAFEHAGGYDFPGEVERVLGGLGLDAIARDRPLATLSGGERARTALARLLLEDPDLLLLDEPTNHLDLAALEWLEKHLLARERSVLVVSHDRYFLDRVTSRTLALIDGAVRAYRGGYSAFARERARELLETERRADRQSREVARQQAFIERERAGSRARQARGRAKQLARLERQAPPAERSAIHWRPTALPLGSERVLETTALTIGFDVPLLRTPALRVERGMRIAIVGPNGSGKTTLLRTLLGERLPLEGHIRAAAGARVASFAQSGSAPLPDGSVLEALCSSAPLDQQQARDLLARFLFRGEEVFRDVGTLSGGERARLALAVLAARPANVLALDEPTNHLDLDAREALEVVLAAYDGTVLLVSHDRYLVDRLATHTWLVDRGAVRPFEGGYSKMRKALEAERAPEMARSRDAAASVGSAHRMAGAGATGAPGRPVRAPRSGSVRERGGGDSAPPKASRPGARKRQISARPPREPRLAELERRIADLERRLEELAQRVAEVAQAGNFMESRRAGEEYGALERELRALYEEWASAEQPL